MRQTTRSASRNFCVTMYGLYTNFMVQQRMGQKTMILREFFQHYSLKKRGAMMYRIPHYVREVKRRLGIVLTLDRVSLLAVVIGAIGVFMLGVLIVKTM